MANLTVDEKAWSLHYHVTSSSEDSDKYVYSVPSSSSDRNDNYIVIHFQPPEIGENEWTCTCKSFHYRGQTSLNFQCSHIKAVHLALENGIITHARSTKDYVMSDTKIGEARLTGELDPKVMESLFSMSEAEAHNTDIVITMRVPAIDFKLREMSFSCYSRLDGTILFSPKHTEIDVQLNADNIRDTPLPTDQMEPPDLSDDEFGNDPESDDSLPF